MALPPPDPQFVLRGTSAPVHTLHFSCGAPEPDIPLLFSGSENGFIHVWNLKTHRVDTALDGHGRKSVYCVETMGSKDRLLRQPGFLRLQLVDNLFHCNSQGRDQRICFWDLAEGRTSLTDSVFTEHVGFCRCSLLKVAQGRWLIAMAARSLEEVGSQNFDLEPDQFLFVFLMSGSDFGAAIQDVSLYLETRGGCQAGHAHVSEVMAVFDFAASGDKAEEWELGELSCGSQPVLLAGYEDGSVVLWNVPMGKALSQLICHQEPVMSLDFDSEKAKGISGSSEKVLSIWSLNEQQNLQVYKTHELVNAGISDITIRPDKKILATAGWDHRIRIFGWKKLKPLAVLDYHTATVHCVSFSDHSNPRDRLLAAGSKDQRISVWSIYAQT
ncbi:Guanine nucleotide-binding protein subunit beta-like protein 1 [Lonchura striata]|uniref:Guanine nucleotide-binding protein subunit beta-like protein 1 n=1 Tax=Lonchura striata TaxID=40157 RepID=A0A218V5F5_9PASE|nr:Guanine nucleotide-binding protein subunit beta-like protein 1 [Lonchura striata domestica]